MSLVSHTVKHDVNIGVGVLTFQKKMVYIFSEVLALLQLQINQKPARTSPKEAIMFEFNTWTNIALGVIWWYVPQFIAFQCAQSGSFWTILEEGYAVLVMRYKAFHKVLLAFTGHKFAYRQSGEGYDVLDEYNIIRDSSRNTEQRSLWTYILNALFPFRGIVWVGIPGVCTVSGNKIRVTEEVRELCLSDILLEGGMRLKIKLSVTQQVTNHAKALIRINDFLESANKYLEGWVRIEFSWLSVYDFVHKTPKANEASVSKLSSALQKINDLTKSIADTWGVTIHQIQVLNYFPADATTENLLTLLTKIRAEADAAIMKAEGQAEITKIEANAAAAAMRANNEAAKELCDNSMRLKELEMLRTANLTAFSGLNVPPMPILPITKGGV